MGTWDEFEERMTVRGLTRRGSSLTREQRMLCDKLRHSLSFHKGVTVDGETQDVAIINSDNLDIKFIYALPGEDIRHGAYVEWMGNVWLVIEKDYNTEVYTKAKMQQCNYLLKWVDDDNVIHEQWCVVEDGTKYLTGEYEDRNFVATRGDSRIAITIARNEFTAKLDRQDRFLIDDMESKHMLAYTLSKPLKFAGVYGENGVYKFVMQEVNTTDDDNQELGIADYYKHFKRKPDADGNPVPLPVNPVVPPVGGESGRGNWL